MIIVKLLWCDFESLTDYYCWYIHRSCWWFVSPIWPGFN